LDQTQAVCPAIDTNSIGAAGIGTTSNPVFTPTFVDMTGALSGKTIASMISTYGGFMVLDTNGLVYVWGDNYSGNYLEFYLLVQVK
jgi:alpha-tubulin suppressor-like RCC1 family protein